MRLQSSLRLRTRHWLRDGVAEVPGAWFQFAAMGLYIALLYKLDVLGVAMMLALCGGMAAMARSAWRLSAPVAALAIAYAALSTLTAFRVSTDAGIFRSCQFVVTVTSTLAIARYLINASADQRAAFSRRFVILNLLILAHVAIYHLATDHLVTWKYLRDTKFVFSAMVLILFGMEDWIRRHGMVLWLGCLGVVSLFILVSGERKAYLSFAVCYLLSRSSLAFKAMTVGAGVLAIGAFVLVAPTSNVARQLSTFQDRTAQLSDRAFLTMHGIADHSDYIRTFVNRNAHTLFMRNPWFGIGSTGYSEWAKEKYGTLLESRGLSMNVHGERNRVPVETGIVGIAVALAYVAACTLVGIFAAIGRGRAGGGGWRLPLHAVIVLVVYCWSEAFDTTMLIFILLTGFLAAGTSADISRQRHLRRETPQRKMRLQPLTK